MTTSKPRSITNNNFHYTALPGNVHIAFFKVKRCRWDWENDIKSMQKGVD